MNQSLLTNFYRSGKNNKIDDMNCKKHNLSLRKSDVPCKRKVEDLEEEEADTNIILLSSDDDSDLPSKNGPDDSSQISVESDSSDKTIIYTPVTPKKNKSTSELQSPPTPVFRSPSSSSKSSESPSKRKKYFSPNKKRNVSLKPSMNQRKLTDFVTNRRLFYEEDTSFKHVSEGVDDKTKFLLKIINDYISQDNLKKLMDEDSIILLYNYFTIPKLAMKLVCRLFWWKEGWYKPEEMKKICLDDMKDYDEKTLTDTLDALVKKNFILAGSSTNMTFHEFTSVLRAEELKEICKELKLKTQSKKSAVEALEEFCKKTPISSFFTKSNTTDNSKRVSQLLSQKVGTCYRLSNLARSTLERLYVLTYLGIDYEAIREKRLELMLINEKIKRETFPINPNMKLDNASIVFENKKQFDRYLFSHCIYEDFLTRIKIEEHCCILKQVYDLYQNIEVDDLISFKTLPTWLQRFTPAYIYIKILDQGIQYLKKGKIVENCQLAVEILDGLIEQTFRKHKRAEWHAEKALILHSYLTMPEEAAKELIKGFESDLSEVAKDCMRPRAKKIALQKNINLNDNTRQTLMAFATKDSIVEGNIPSRHFYKQPMENQTKGKAVFETKNEHGRVMQGVEEYARSQYVLSGEYTDGDHWEGKIVTTIFFLLFWDIIYSKPKNARGIFLCHLQKYPLDMFCEEFYTNRKEAIDAKLKLIENLSTEELLEIMQIVWDDRPESELSGISRDIGWARVAAVSACLGGRRAAAICARLARDFRHARSGFPDLTLWNTHTNQIKFVEVKSDSDKPSMKQIQWMQYLLENGIETEFCYVGANTTRPKARQPARKSL